MGLLATDEGKKTLPTQQAGALFVLADLKHLSFALELLGEMWGEADISPSAACWLIDKCLRSNDEKLQEEAAAILRVSRQRVYDLIRQDKLEADTHKNIRVEEIERRRQLMALRGEKTERIRQLQDEGLSYEAAKKRIQRASEPE